MAKKQKEQPVLTLDGEEHFAKDMSEEQLRIKDHLADLTNKLNTNVFIAANHQNRLITFILRQKEG